LPLAPFFTRNLLILRDGAKITSAMGEVPGGGSARRWKTPAGWSWASRLGRTSRMLQQLRQQFADRDSGGGSDL
jgi:glucarate dehydratase